MSFSLSEYTKIDIGWGFDQTPVGELTALPRPSSWFQGTASRQDGNGGEEREGLGGRGEGGWGREGKRRKLGK